MSARARPITSTAAAQRFGAAVRRALSALLVAALTLAGGVPAWAQPTELPRLGEAGGDELSPALERKIGESIMRDIRRSRELLDDADIDDYLNKLAARLARVPGAAGFSFELFAIEDRSINAFALPGGFIGVHTGLIAASQAESELASVLAHEIGHVTQRHIARMLSAQKQSSNLALASLLAAVLAARANPQAAAGIVSLGSSVQMQQMLGFSRDAEREADRTGLEMLQQSGFDSQGMVDFFGRLQSATRLTESALPTYLRTHPLTGERMADIQNRVMTLRYRQHADSLEFGLLRARLRALADRSVDGLRRTRAMLARQLEDGAIERGTGQFAIAANAAALRDAPVARQALAAARAALPTPHPYLDRLAAEIEIDAGQPEVAIALVDQAVTRFGRSRALSRVKVAALNARSDWAGAVAECELALESWRADAMLWESLARAQAARGNTSRAHLAMAEHHALGGAWLPAIEQLQAAQRARQLDFYASSEIDARIRQLRAIHLQELEDRRAGR